MNKLRTIIEQLLTKYKQNEEKSFIDNKHVKKVIKKIYFNEHTIYVIKS